MKHLTHDQLSAQLDHALTGRAAEEAERHLLECATCREALADLAAQETELKPALVHDPGEAYFERFAARVEERLRAEGLAGAQGRERHAGSWWSSPRTLAWAGAAAAVIAGAGLVLITGRDVRPPSLRDREIAGRLDQRATESREATPAPKSAADQASGGVATSPSPSPPGEAERASRATNDRVAEPQREEAHEFLTGNPRVLARDRGAEPQAARPSVARPGAASEVKNNAAGEPIPVRGDRTSELKAQAPAAAAVPSPAPSPSPAPTDAVDGVRKKTAVQPMQTKDEDAKARMAKTAEESAPSATTAPSAAAAPSAATLMFNETAPGRLCGEVRDMNGRPIAGAVVVVEDVSRTTSTDAHGAFCLDAPAGEHPLTVMALGFAESRQSVEVSGQEASVRVKLAAVPVLETGGKSTWGSSKALYGSAPLGYRQMQSPPPDPYAVQPDSVRKDVQMARQLETSGGVRRSAAMFDAAAIRWEKTLRAVAGSPLDLETRGHVADARYRAWEVSPNPQRAGAAIVALTSFVSRAPGGAEREEALRRLERVRR